MKIQVTQEDIVNGIRNECNCCPIALAVRRAMPEAQNVEVECFMSDANIPYNFTVWTEDNIVHYVAENPQEVNTFAAKFDNHEFVHPFAFTATEVC